MSERGEEDGSTISLSNMTGTMFQLLWVFLAAFSTIVLSAVLAFLIGCRYVAHRKRQDRRRQHGQQHIQNGPSPPLIVGFFHPYCSSGGGGERVLWKIVQVLLHQSLEQHEEGKSYPKPENGAKGTIHVLIYTIDPPTPTYRQDVLNHVKDRFAIDLTNSPTQKEGTAESAETFLSFIHLHESRHLLLPASRLSLLVESLRTIQLAWNALTYSWALMPDIFVDTTGYAFTYMVANLCMGCRVWAYVHYPTISTDMLQLVWQQRRATYNHAAYIAQSKLATYAKLAYYCFFAVLYGFTGSLAHIVLVNSTWTYNHIYSLWKLAAWQSRIQIVYPPCQVSELLSKKPIMASSRKNVVLSIGQFRPEKDHVLQIEALARLHESYPEWKGKIKLVLLGSCRGVHDQERVEYLQKLASDKHHWTEKDIEFIVNQPYSVVQEWLSKASMGIHTMWNEHFGIGIVEMMAAGLVVVAHNSGGPKSDIVQIGNGKENVDNHDGRTGFLGRTADDYAECIHQILTMNPAQVEEIRTRAQKSADRFSDDVFAQHMERVFSSHLYPRK